LRSLQEQSINDFEVYFVDYGSHKELAQEIEGILKAYSFVNYTHYPTYHQPWNKCRALNSVVKHLKTDFCFVADIDMIFHHDFVQTALSLQDQKTAVYFQVGFLNAAETKTNKSFDEYTIDFKSTHEATGLTMFPVKALQEINGFDEFYHFWGAEDTDAHVRMKNAGYKVLYYDKQILMLHQWHQSYRSKESKKLTSELRLTNAVKLNHQYLKSAIEKKTIKVNKNGWGKPLTLKAFNTLENNVAEPRFLSLQRAVIDHFLYHELPDLKNTLNVVIRSEDRPKPIQAMVKKILGKQIPKFYTLKEANDLLLGHIVNFFRDYDYNLKINVDKQEINLKIRKPEIVTE
jgi:glycosyltransferase involved in cell wall biosynthesis